MDKSDKKQDDIAKSIWPKALEGVIPIEVLVMAHNVLSDMSPIMYVMSIDVLVEMLLKYSANALKCTWRFVHRCTWLNVHKSNGGTPIKMHGEMSIEMITRCL